MLGWEAEKSRAKSFLNSGEERGGQVVRRTCWIYWGLERFFSHQCTYTREGMIFEITNRFVCKMHIRVKLVPPVRGSWKAEWPQWWEQLEGPALTWVYQVINSLFAFPVDPKGVSRKHFFQKKISATHYASACNDPGKRETTNGGGFSGYLIIQLTDKLHTARATTWLATWKPHLDWLVKSITVQG